MAYGDYSYFTPAESLYTKPGAADERARQEAIKKASYLSSMDQFYESLAESTRQFNQAYKLQERAAILAEKEQGEVSTYRTKALEQEKELAKESYALQRQQLSQQYELGLAGYATELQAAKIRAKAEGGGGAGYESSGYLSPYQYEEDKMREAVLKGGV